MMPDFLLHQSPIFLGPLAKRLPLWLENQAYSKLFVIVDENTQQHCLPYFLKTSGLTGSIMLTQIPSGEAQKNLINCEIIWQSMLEAQLDRKALVINLGGGVIGDLGGFCAATWKRGIDFVQVPTTLLAMTDAAIGGKTGIDFQGIKNTIGVFQQPAAVFVDLHFLKTLPKREYRSGYAEVIKHAVIAGISDSLTSSETITNASLQKSIAVKVQIVQEDPLEKGQRMLLNFGHTIGHALESLYVQTDHPLTHGEAVYIGMICEASIAAFSENRLRELLEPGRAAFPYRHIPEATFGALWGLILQDKKNSSGTVRIAVPDEMPYTLRLVEISAADLAPALTFYNKLGESANSMH